MRDYLQHGMRHAAGGSDPIPNSSAALAWGQGGTQTTAAGTTANVAFDTVRASDASLFAWSTTSVTNDTLTIKNSGAAIVMASAYYTAGATNANIFIDSASGGIFRHSGWLTGQAILTAPPEGFGSIMDQVWLDLPALNTEVKCRFSNNEAFDDGPTAIWMTVLFFPNAFTPA